MAEDLVILKGKTFSRIVRWETSPLVYKSITAITKAAPVKITATTHGVPDGWRVAVVSAGGMRQINAKNWPLRSADFHVATYFDANTITLNAINSTDYTAYTSGGSLVYNTPVALAGFSARMQIRETVEAVGTPLVNLSSVSPATDIVLDDVAKTITITIAATATDDFTWDTGVYDLELVSPSGVVTQLLSGNVTAVDEVTR